MCASSEIQFFGTIMNYFALLHYSKADFIFCIANKSQVTFYLLKKNLYFNDFMLKTEWKIEVLPKSLNVILHFMYSRK